jgi:transcriptional regulator of acetoin/glycerol metabolism
VRYAFPGNVRELEKILTAALAESPRGHIRAPESIDLGSPATATASIPAARSRAELPSKEQVKEALEATGGNVKEAAQRLGVSRDALNRLIAKYWPRGPEGG